MVPTGLTNPTELGGVFWHCLCQTVIFTRKLQRNNLSLLEGVKRFQENRRLFEGTDYRVMQELVALYQQMQENILGSRLNKAIDLDSDKS